LIRIKAGAHRASYQMPMEPSEEDLRWYRARAEEIRARARLMENEETRSLFLKVANEYERLSAQAEAGADS
jgi:hypothetical protein